MEMNRTVTIKNITRGTVLADRAEVADTPHLRTRGLLKHDRLDPGQGLFFTGGLIPTNNIHSFGMKFVFDAVFLDRDFRVAHCIHRMKQWRISRIVFSGVHLVELPAGRLEQCETERGDRIEVIENE